MSNRFSRRNGYVKEQIQIESLNSQTRTKLWNVWYEYFWELLPVHCHSKFEDIDDFMVSYWVDFSNSAIDEIPMRTNDDREQEVDTWKLYYEMRGIFYHKEWFIVFDFIEFTASMCADNVQDYTTETNAAFKKTNTSYRIVNGLIIPIIGEAEVEAIQTSLEFNDKLKVVSDHIETALQHLSNREKPDYRNSIKESISAVESLCKIISGNDKGTLPDALKELEKKNNLHPALKTSFSSLYSYTSDSSGIRHALKANDDEATIDEARYILVTCSAFVNYLRTQFEI